LCLCCKSKSRMLFAAHRPRQSNELTRRSNGNVGPCWPVCRGTQYCRPHVICLSTPHHRVVALIQRRVWQTAAATASSWLSSDRRRTVKDAPLLLLYPHLDRNCFERSNVKKLNTLKRFFAEMAIKDVKRSKTSFRD